MIDHYSFYIDKWIYSDSYNYKQQDRTLPLGYLYGHDVHTCIQILILIQQFQQCMYWEGSNWWRKNWYIKLRSYSYCTVKPMAVKSFVEFDELQFTKCVANSHYFHNIPYANGLQFAKVFHQTSYSPYSPNLFTAKVFYNTVVTIP